MTQPGKTVAAAVNLSGLISLGVLTICEPANRQELDLFTHYASILCSDGDAMCLALAQQRQWFVATDDRRMMRMAEQAGLTAVSCPELMKAWADATGPAQSVLKKVLQDIEDLAQFKPHPSLPEYQWWVDELGNGGP